MKNINEIKSFVDEQEIFIMPDVRIIGKAHRCTFNWETPPWGEIWDSYIAVGDVLKSLPKVINNGFIAWTGDSPEGSDMYTYMPAIICPANTPVPEGLDYRDIPHPMWGKVSMVMN